MIARKARAVALGLLMVLALAGPGPAGRKRPAPSPTTPIELDCGPIALHALLHSEGVSRSIDEVAARLPAPRPGGFSMKELRDAAGSLGLALDGLAIGRDARAIDRPLLAFLKVDGKGHFVAVRPVGHTGRLAQVIDSNQSPRVLEKFGLVASEQWTGLVLAPRRATWPIVAAGAVAAPALGGLAVAASRRRRARAGAGTAG